MRPIKLLALLSLTLSSAALAQASGAGAAQDAAEAPVTTAHDGHWRVDLVTTVGNCTKEASVVLGVRNSKIASIDTSGVDPWGYIDETNTFVGHFSSGEKVLRANGTVMGEFAKGPWSSQTEFCGGTWSARKLD